MEKISKNQLKYYSSLLNKKYRKTEKKFIVEGFKLISEAVSSSYVCEAIIATEKNITNAKKLFVDYNFTYFIAAEKEFERLSDTVNPQGIAGVFSVSKKKSFPRNIKIVAALENISDPGNLGTILRNCDWFGISDIILSPDCAEIFNPKTLRASMGSVFHLNFILPDNFYNEIIRFKQNGYTVLNSDMNGENIYQFKIPEKIVVVFSNEANGPTKQIGEIADYNITIPKFGNAESLNVACASAIILSEIFAANQIVSHK